MAARTRRHARNRAILCHIRVVKPPKASQIGANIGPEIRIQHEAGNEHYIHG
jgi:hypothetical protein